MKIRQLHINRFGHFTERDLDFPGNGLHLIYGPNEAGKTTLLEFIRGLLFDFPKDLPYDFGGAGKVAGVGTFELQDGRTVELRRTKANKDKVSIKLDGLLTDYDDSRWLGLIGHADKRLFESVFAFGLDKLSQGEESLKHESLRSALFGGGLGSTVSPEKITAELTRQAEELFKKGGSKPSINSLLADLKKLSKDVKEQSLRPDKYHEIEKAAETAIETSRTLQQEVDRLRREHSIIERLSKASPKWIELQQKQAARNEITVPDNVPADSRHKYEILCNELATVESDKAKRISEIRLTEDNIKSLKLNPEAASHRAEIKSCTELLRSYLDARDQLPDRLQKREALRLLIDRELNDLRPGWGHHDLLAFKIDLKSRTELNKLKEEQQELATARIKLSATRESDLANLERGEVAIAEMGPPSDVTQLELVLVDEAEFLANRKQLETHRNEYSKLERKLDNDRRALSPPLVKTSGAIEELPVPRIETIASFKTRFAELRERIRIANDGLEKCETEKALVLEALDVALLTRTVPTLAERDIARTRRDLGWNLVRKKFIEGESAETEISEWLATATESFPDSYELAVKTADNVADQIFGDATEVANRENLRQQLRTVQSRLEANQHKIVELQQHLAELQNEWDALWQPCQLAPLDPEAMTAWIKDHAAVCKSIFQFKETNAAITELQAKISAFHEQLKTAAGGSEDEPMALLKISRRKVDETKEQKRKATTLQNEIKQLQKQLGKFDQESEKLQLREEEWGRSWEKMLASLNFPSTWQPAFASDVIEKLNATRVYLDSLPGENVRISAMTSRVSEFQDRVKSLCQRLAPSLLEISPDIAIGKLDEQSQLAIEAQQQNEGLLLQLTKARREVELLDEQFTGKSRQKSQLFDGLRVKDEADFFECVERSEKVRELDGEIELLTRDIDLIRGNDERADFETRLASSERAVLLGQVNDLSEQLASAEEAKRKAYGDEALARDVVKKMDGSGAVARMSEALAESRSLLSENLDRYMPLIYARHLLNSAVNRFEKENQPEMIATVSQLFAQMTGGKYVEFERTSGSKQNIIVRQSDGSEKTPDQMSTGTREQLYLAIRLAYVCHYCNKNEPLPIIVDDVLVNFDAKRARDTLAVLAETAKTAQVLFFTCHPHMVELAQESIPGLQPIQLQNA